MVFDGTWNATIATPMGKQSVVLQISTENENVRGTANYGAETSPFLQPVADGNRLKWTLNTTKPVSMTLKFDIKVDGPVMVGTVKAGIMPAVKLTGERVA